MSLVQGNKIRNKTVVVVKWCGYLDPGDKIAFPFLCVFAFLAMANGCPLG
jgi:hypothetical protein